MAPASANAAYLVQVLGLFGADAPVTAESSPNLQFTLSFNLPSPFNYSDSGTGIHSTTDAYNFSYTLDGQNAGSGLQYMAFADGVSYPAQLDILFQDQTTFAFVGPRIEFDGTLSSPSYNFYVTYIAPSGESYTSGGPATITITNVADSPVPEPATWAMMIGGFGLVGGSLRRTRRMVAVAA